MQDLELVIFDLAGTTVEDRGEVPSAFTDALAEYNIKVTPEQVNAVRGMDGLTPWSNQVPALQILEHERQVNLFLEMRRLADMYRFGLPSPEWQATSAAASKPGTFFPIAYSEALTNCYIAGTCNK